MQRNSLGQFARSHVHRILGAVDRFGHRLYHRLASFFFAFVLVLWGVGVVGFHINELVQDALAVMAYATYVRAASSTPEVATTTVKDVPPILERIAKCESPKGQYDKNGKTIRGAITPSDLGKYQINDIYWGQKAHDLGFDLYTEQGNEAMALWIYEHHGTEPWHSSAKCWR